MTTCPAHLRRLHRDSSVFFCVLVADIVALICTFAFRTAPKARDPRKLALTTSIDSMQHVRVSSYCVDRCNNIVVVDAARDRVNVFYAHSGDLILQVGVGAHRWPAACVMDRAGNFYVSETAKNCVSVFMRDGTFSHDVGSDGVLQPYGLDLSRDESVVYVASHHYSSVVECSTASGMHLLHIGRCLSRQYDAVTVLTDGALACAWTNCERPNARAGGVSIFESNGTRIGDIDCSSLAPPEQIVSDSNNNMYVQSRGTLVAFMPTTQQMVVLRVYARDGIALQRDGGLLVCTRRQDGPTLFSVYH
jgi:hypothetical protein